MGEHHESDHGFTGSVPEFYERYMVPLMFGTYADDMATRVARQHSGVSDTRVLEVAAGSGVVTRAMATALPDSASIVATDLNQPMLDHAASIGTARPVDWKQADVMALPFDDDSFDIAVCQFGVMFFADRRAAYAEVLRVLRPGGLLVFSTWDRIEENEFPHEVEVTLALRYPNDPPLFMSRTPHGYFDRAAITADVEAAGFAPSPTIDTLDAQSRAASAELVAQAFCMGTPLRAEIEAREPSGLDAVIEASTAALERRFGTANLVGKISGLVVTAIAP